VVACKLLREEIEIGKKGCCNFIIVMFAFNEIVMKRMVGMCQTRWNGVVEILARATESVEEHSLSV